ncbi:DUF3459 domain-containing protein [Rhodobacterales bacterium HKCCE3408]|nr:DUF3459 domain-containing protein [Rhodobacterales bacterium HKCCE3408]
MIGRLYAQLLDAVMRDGAGEGADPARWWQGAIFYQVYVRSFRDANGDGIGDIAGVTEKLDYLAGLGVDGIWLSPFYPSPQVDFGYDITDLRDVDPIHGTLDDVLRMLEAAHDRGLRVIADFVPCHTSDRHPWFRESRESRTNPRHDWYVWADPGPDGTEPNNWLSSFGGRAWTWEPRRSQYYYHPFLACQPALNLRNDDVLREMIDAMIFWRDLGFDGFRLDAVQCIGWDRNLRSNPARVPDEDDVEVGGGPNNPFSMQVHLFDRDAPFGQTVLEKMRSEICPPGSDAVLIGEMADLDSTRLAVKYTAGDTRLHAAYDFDLIQKTDSLHRWIDTLQARSRYIGDGWLMNVLTNHDTVRAVSALAGEAVEAGFRTEAAKLLLFLQATLRGGAIIFQGEELGLPQPQLDREDIEDPWGLNLYPDFPGRDAARTPFPWSSSAVNGGFGEGAEPWLPMPDAHRPLAADDQDGDPGSVLSFVRRLLAWRRTMPVLRTGGDDVCDPDGRPLLRFERFGGGERLRIVANLGTEDLRLASEGQPLDFPTQNATATADGLTLGPFGFAVLDHARA